MNYPSILLEKSSGVFWRFPEVREIWEFREFPGKSWGFPGNPGFPGNFREIPGNPGISGVPGTPPKSGILGDFPGKSGISGKSGSRGVPGGPGFPGGQGGILGGIPGGARIRGPESATLARFLGVFGVPRPF